MLPLIGAIIPMLGGIIDKVVPDKNAAAKIKAEIAKEEANMEGQLQLAQLALQTEDAKSGVGGFRWAAGMLTVASLAYSWLLYPIGTWALVAFDVDIIPPPAVATEAQFIMLTGMLGLSGVRSFDLAKGSRK